MKVFVLFAISLAFIFTACNKEYASSKSSEDADMLKSASYEEAFLLLKGDL